MFRKKIKKIKPYTLRIIANDGDDRLLIAVSLTDDWKLWFSNPLPGQGKYYFPTTNGQERINKLVDEFRETIESLYKEEK